MAMLKRIVATAVVLFALDGTATAQGQFGVFSVDPSNSRNIILNGPIGDSAGLDFRRIIRASPSADTLILNSPGGLLSIGILIADEAYEAGFSTIIPNGAGCYSSCAFIFFAGRGRTALGELGVHQFASDRPDQVGDQYAVADIVDLFDRFGVDVRIISIMMRTPPDDIYVFSAVEIEQYSINRTDAAVAAPGEALVGCAASDRGLAAFRAGDYVIALAYLRPCALLGNAFAQFVLGYMYHNGNGVVRNDIEAVRLYRLAADQGYAIAQSNLGVMYQYGYGVPENDIEAVRLYRLAADQGDAVAQYNLGYMYYYGEGLSQSASAAVRWFRLAAEQGDEYAQGWLGSLYWNGEGVAKDDVLAYMWWNIAAANGLEEAASRRDDVVAPHLSAEQIAEAQRLAREWFEAHPN